MFTELTQYRPTKVDDGQGGYTMPALGTGTTIWGLIQIHEGERELVTRKEETILNEDILLIDGQYYRVIGKVGHQRGPYMAYFVEATQKPLVP